MLEMVRQRACDDGSETVEEQQEGSCVEAEIAGIGYGEGHDGWTGCTVVGWCLSGCE